MSYGQQVAPVLRIVLDLTNARDRVQIIPPGQPIRQVYVALLVAGANLELQSGLSNPGIPMVQTGSLVFFDALTEGLYATNTAQPAVTATLAIVTGVKEA